MNNKNVHFLKKEKKLYCHYDVIIVGSGISGLMCALNISREMKILIISKSELKLSNSSLAQGGIAASIGLKNKVSHIEDTLEAGCYLNNKEVVEKIVNYSDELIEKLIEYGVAFDRDKNGNILFTKEGGHSERRILHCKDQTGEKIVESLILELRNRKNVDILEFAFVLDLYMKNNDASAVIAIDQEGYSFKIFSKKIVLASGGLGNLFEKTTNVNGSTADGIAMAIRAGACLKDMEFVQFHPTAFNVNIEEGFLISEAVRGEGAKLINSYGEDFMDAIHSMKELAPRDVVSQAIFRQIKEGKSVWLDIRHKPKSYLIKRFPKIYKHCLSKGIDITKDLIPISPVQHYFMGGIEVDARGRTSIQHLYAIGECANTGAHGANRLASNSLLESAAYALIVSREINTEMTNCNEKRQKNDKYDNKNIENLCSNIIDNISAYSDEILKLKNGIQKIMSRYVYIEKTRDGLKYALNELLLIEERLSEINTFTVSFYELLNMLTVSKEIVKSSLGRESSIGSHIINDRSL